MDHSDDRFVPARPPTACFVPGRRVPIALGDVWRDLLAGREVIEHTFATRTHCYMVLRSRAPDEATANAVSARQRGMLEAWLAGTSQKCVGAEWALSTSSIADQLKRALRLMGLRCTANRVPVLLVMAANATSEDVGFATARLRGVRRVRSPDVPCDQDERAQRDVRLIVRAPHPVQELTRALSDAEREVLRLRVDGRSLAEIALARGTRARTVANQLASAFRKECVSGRVELAVELVLRQLEAARQLHRSRAA